ncbi:hypothetical protein J2Y67_001765 [Neobacillus niacini]|nr:hypothetical protein [Neobacillus niacini]
MSKVSLLGQADAWPFELVCGLAHKSGEMAHILVNTEHKPVEKEQITFKMEHKP